MVIPGILASAQNIAAGVGGYSAENGADFDGSSDYLDISGSLTGAAASKLVTFSLWFKLGVHGDEDALFRIGSDKFLISLESAGGTGIEVLGKASGGGTQLRVRADTQATTGAWHHLLCSFDMADSGKRHLYIDDVSSLDTVSTYKNSVINFADSGVGVGAEDDGANKIDGALQELWFFDGVYTDFSVTANRRKFIDASSKPVDLGSDGSTPTGGEPTLYLNNEFSTFQTDKTSNNNDFTENGALSDEGTSPSD